MTRPHPAPPTLSALRRRAWSLRPDVAFLNHGSFGACPIPVLREQQALRAALEAEPVQFLWRNYEDRLEPARAELARFLGSPSRDLAFVPNTTAGINAVSRSLPLRRGDEILTTNLDYNACHNALAEAARRSGARLVTAPLPFPIRNHADIVERILEAVTPRTRLAMIDHVTSDTALVIPIADIIRELETRGVDVLVDGAHAPGMVPVHLQRLRPAYYTGNLHKWVCAPKGAAFLYVRPDKQDAIQPHVVSHGNNRPRPGFSPFQDRFDWTGTFDPTPWMCVGIALRWMNSLLPGGWTELRRRNHALAIHARRLLCRELDLVPPCPESMLGSMATLPLPAPLQGRPRAGRIDPEQLELYDRFQIEVPLSRIGTPSSRWFRISAQAYNSLPDYARLAHALRELAGGSSPYPPQTPIRRSISRNRGSFRSGSNRGSHPK